MKQVDLTNGPITSSLAKLAFPIMGTSFIQMAYNLTDMIWIGRIGSGAVAAVGAAGMFTWLFNGMIVMPKMGGQVKVAHALGAEEAEKAAEYARGDIQLGIFLSLFFGVICMFLAHPLISFFKLTDPTVIRQAEVYLMITGGLVFFNFMNQIFTGLMTAMGSSIVTFRSTTVGLVLNIILDPLFIYGAGPIPKMGVAGAAVATVLAQIVVFLLYLKAIWNEPVIFSRLKLFRKTSGSCLKEILKIGFPIGMQSMIFSGVSMTLARIVAGYGDSAVAIQKVGAQIESIAWMTADGFGSAVNSFVAQNHGANKNERIKKGYFTALRIMIAWGLFTSLILFFLPEPLMRIFIQEPDVIPLGVDYLKILAFCEIFACTEMTSAGAFQGMGKPVYSSTITVLFTVIRIPMALLLSATALGLNGVWWSVSISGILRGLLMPVCFIIFLYRYMRREQTGGGKLTDGTVKN